MDQVLHYGLQDASRNKFKLALHCIMIVTSVVPPELPMELSLAVTSSLAALSHALVFCTEPFRIPFAGKLNVLCFDKTGTLTKDLMILKGVVSPSATAFFPPSPSGSLNGTGAGAAELEAADSTVVDPAACPAVVWAVMGACHALVQRPGGKYIGQLKCASMCL